MVRSTRLQIREVLIRRLSERDREARVFEVDE
jgi:hypothetical protein